MKRPFIAPVALSLLSFALTATTMAQVSPTFSTDRFGVEGTVTRYESLSDAMNGINSTATINIVDRDLSIYVARGTDNANIIMGSWWYTINPDHGTYSGWGNVNGNTGIGFNQLYDADASTTSSLSMAFGDQVGPIWTSFTLSLTGTNAVPGYPVGDAARFSLYGNTNDSGIYHEYALNVTATGLVGNELAPGVIEATNHPTGVTGSFTGIFESTALQSPLTNGFFVFDLSLNMENWAYENSANLNGAFFDSYFAVPEPATYAAWLAGLTLVVLTVRRRWRRNGR